MSKDIHIAGNTNITYAMSIPDSILKLDLNAVKYKLIKEENWALERADFIEGQYKGFLSLVALFPEETHVPTQDIDEMWHTHILDTRKYMADCYAVFGRYLHHYPYEGLMSADDKAQAEAMFAATKSRLVSLGIDVDSVAYASDCGGGGGCSSSSCSSSSCSSGSNDSPSSHDTPSTNDSPSHIWPTIASCSTSSTNDTPRRRENTVNDNRERKREDKPKRSWWPRLNIWSQSVNPDGFGNYQRPDRAAVELLAAERKGPVTFN